MYLVSFDVGGTFIDFFVFDSVSGQVEVRKVDSSRTDLGRAIGEGLKQILEDRGLEPSGVSRVAHGTTIVTNQIIERAGARVGVVATSGFRDVLEIGRMRRRSFMDLGESRRAPLVDRTMRLEVPERVTPAGVMERRLDPEEASRVVNLLIGAGAEAIAACLLNSFANPENEEVIAAACAAAGIPCSLSSRVAPEYGEFERWLTAVLNSHVMPRAKEYLEDVSRNLAALGVQVPLEVMQSSGGTIRASSAVTYPVRLIESGPAAGVAAAAEIASEAGYHRIITLDMGGTSADVSVVLDNEPHLVSEYSVDEQPVRAIGIDVRSVGAGGGSIGWLDRMGSLQVGPASAGAVPGPACYDRGGTAPTVTDANLVLGYIDGEAFCAGTKPLNTEAARRALATIANPLGVTVEETAIGIVRLAVARMAGAVRTITTQAGYDPRDCALVAFGGAGPTHASWVADELEIPDILIPWEPALLSARGLLMAEHRSDVYRTLVSRLEEADFAWVSDQLRDLDAQARAEVTAGDQAGSAPRTVFTLELCYEGQQDLIPVRLDRFPLSAGDRPGIESQLDKTFQERYGFVPAKRVPQIMRVRATAFKALVLPPSPAHQARGVRAPGFTGTREAYISPGWEPITARVLQRADMAAGEVIEGPCIVEEPYSSTIVLTDQTVSLDTYMNLRVKAKTGSSA